MTGKFPSQEREGQRGKMRRENSSRRKNFCREREEERGKKLRREIVGERSEERERKREVKSEHERVRICEIFSR